MDLNAMVVKWCREREKERGGASAICVIVRISMCSSESFLLFHATRTPIYIHAYTLDFDDD